MGMMAGYAEPSPRRASPRATPLRKAVGALRTGQDFVGRSAFRHQRTFASFRAKRVGMWKENCVLDVFWPGARDAAGARVWIVLAWQLPPSLRASTQRRTWSSASQ